MSRVFSFVISLKPKYLSDKKYDITIRCVKILSWKKSICK